MADSHDAPETTASDAESGIADCATHPERRSRPRDSPSPSGPTLPASPDYECDVPVAATTAPPTTGAGVAGGGECVTHRPHQPVVGGDADQVEKPRRQAPPRGVEAGSERVLVALGIVGRQMRIAGGPLLEEQGERLLVGSSPSGSATRVITVNRH